MNVPACFKLDPSGPCVEPERMPSLGVDRRGERIRHKTRSQSDTQTPRPCGAASASLPGIAGTAFTSDAKCEHPDASSS